MLVKNHHLVKVNHHLSLILDIVMITIWFPWGSSSAGGAGWRAGWTKNTGGTTRKWNGCFFAGSFLLLFEMWTVSPPKKNKNGWLRLVFLVKICFVWWTVSRTPFDFFSGLFIVRRLNMGKEQKHKQPMYFFVHFWSQLGRKVACTDPLLGNTSQSTRWYFTSFRSLGTIFTPKLFWWKSDPIWLQSICFFSIKEGWGLTPATVAKLQGCVFCKWWLANCSGIWFACFDFWQKMIQIKAQCFCDTCLFLFLGTNGSKKMHEKWIFENRFFETKTF